MICPLCKVDVGNRYAAIVTVNVDRTETAYGICADCGRRLAVASLRPEPLVYIGPEEPPPPPAGAYIHVNPRPEDTGDER